MTIGLVNAGESARSAAPVRHHLPTARAASRDRCPRYPGRMKPPSLPQHSANELENLATMNPEVRARAVELNRRELVPYLEMARRSAELLCERLPPDLHWIGFEGSTLAARIHHLWEAILRLERLDPRLVPEEAITNIARHAVEFIEWAAMWQQATVVDLEARLNALTKEVGGYSDAAMQTIQTAVAKSQIEIDEHVAGTVSKLKGDAKDADELLNGIRKAHNTATAAGEAKHFRAMARLHRAGAAKWLRCSAAIAAIVVIFLLVLAAVNWPIEHTPRTGFDIARFFTVRALCAVAGYYLLNLAVRNYRAHQHNEVINRHREKALQTFENFYKGSKDDRVKDAVLLQASTAVFSAHSTGFLGGDEVVTQGAIIDAIKLATGAPPSPPAQPPAPPP